MTYQLYWGDLHSHCSISYGHGTVEQALRRAREQLDFCSVTGHAFWPDMPTDRSRYAEIIDYHTTGFARLAKNWPQLLKLQDEATAAGDFIALPSYEWHSLASGDHNVYAAGPHLSLEDAADLSALRDLAIRTGALMIPHHVGYRAGYRGINWDDYDEQASPFVEVFSLHGCSLSDDAPYPMLHDMGPRDAGSTAEEGWRRGYRFGIVGGTDHHAAYPGSHGDGRMGVFAERLTRDALFDAFRARRVYAATGDRIEARMWLNDAFIGDTVRAPDERVIRLVVRGSDALDKVELVRNGRVIRRFFPDSNIAASTQQGQDFRLRITWGWGRNTVPVGWDGRLDLQGGRITDCESLFSGQSVVAPQAEEERGSGNLLEDVDLPHSVLESTADHVCWRSITMGNKTMRHETTQGLSLGLHAPLSARIVIEVNGHSFEHALGELLGRGRSHFLNGWLSEAIRIGPLVPIHETTVEAEFRDLPDRETDVYRINVAQKNDQWAWLSPIWAEQ